MPVNEPSSRVCTLLVTGKNAELKRLDGMSEKPELLASRAFMRDASGKTRFKQGMFKTKSVD